MASCKVLVVENHGEIRQFLAAAAAERCEVDAVGSAAEARGALARGGPYQLMILNLDPAAADGLALAAEARRRGSLIIVIPHRPSHFARAAREGFYILTKPLDRRRLLELVDRARARISS